MSLKLFDKNRIDIKYIISRVLYYFGFSFKLKRINYNDFEDIKKAVLTFKNNDDIKSCNKFYYKISGHRVNRTHFIGVGGSHCTTQAHTIVKRENQYLFEKVFDVQSQEFQVLKKNYSYFYTELEKQAIHIPKLIKIDETELIAFCYFQFIPRLEMLDDWRNAGFKLIRKFKNIQHISMENQKSYTELGIIRAAMTKLMWILIDFPDLLSKLLFVKTYIDKQKTVFTHGDFYKRNIYKNCMLDWDDMGFYPFGIDIVFILHNDGFFSDKNLKLAYLFEYLDKSGFNQDEKIGIVYFSIIIESYLGNLNFEEAFCWISEIYEQVRQR